uniref:DUF4407 domain-containing protein n=1 Tax=Rhodopseudomonas palustris (strain BisA53) TaxID=316055 RepID=Q07ID7_RHOP5
MIQRLFNFVAGVDYKTMSTCPTTDRMWASQLGFSLCLSFTVVFGVSFYATGYMIESSVLRGVIAFVVALTVLMFDRALCQSDWFSQGASENIDNDVQTHEEVRTSLSRFLRIGARFGMSLGFAWVIAMFMELAIFSDTISEKIERDRIANNKPIFEKIESFESQLVTEIDRNRAYVAELEAALRTAAAEVPLTDLAVAAGSEEVQQQVKKIGAREEELRAEIAQLEQSVHRYTEEMNAEEFGQKLFPSNTGRVGIGARYEFAKRQKEAYEAQLSSRQTELAQLLAKRDEIRKADADLLISNLAMRERELAVIQAKRESLQANLEKARTSLKQLEVEKALRLKEFQAKVLAESYFLSKKDYVDPLRRIAAYQDLKNDPKDGPIITLFSWMTRFFIIFLEIVPVVAKIFFSPPSVYAAKVQAQIKRERRTARLMEEASLTAPEWALEELAMARAERRQRSAAEDSNSQPHHSSSLAPEAAKPAASDWWQKIEANRAAMLAAAPTDARRSAAADEVAQRAGEPAKDDHPDAVTEIRPAIVTPPQGNGTAPV